MPLAYAIGLRRTVIEVHYSHYWFVVFLVLKEVIVYYTCVRRANHKLLYEYGREKDE